jgi:hypothetical protein
MDRSVILWQLISAIGLGRSAVSRGSEVHSAQPPFPPSRPRFTVGRRSHPPQPHGRHRHPLHMATVSRTEGFAVALVAPRLPPTDPYARLVDGDNVIYSWSRSTNATSCLRGPATP